MSYRYIAINPNPVVDEHQILMRTNDEDDLQRFIQSRTPSEVEVYQLKYVVENVLCDVSYENDYSEDVQTARESL